LLNRYTWYHLLLISLVAAIFILYPDITWLPFELDGVGRAEWLVHIEFFIFRYAFIAALIFTLIKINVAYLSTPLFKQRLLYSFLIAIVCYGIYGGITYLIFTHVRHFGSLVLFQFFMVSLLTALSGHIFILYTEKRKKEQQIEVLTVANLQSRYDALTNQINPHFFFNSLNGLTSLIRKNDSEMTLNYVNKLSDVFRYILQSDKKGLITLAEELAFVDAFKYMMEVRFATKLKYNIDIDESLLGYRLPALSILPLLDNIVVHNTIDSDHKMVVTLTVNDNNDLVVSNPIYPKLTAPVTNGTGLENLESRFMLLMGKPITVEDDGKLFTVYLPLS
jgi:LytS/YehU family sensor histidine kinase